MRFEFVLFQIFRQLESGIAKGALVWLDMRVSGLVSVSGALLHESQSANVARMSDVSQMSAHVSLERPFVCKSLLTSFNVAKEKSVVCVVVLLHVEKGVQQYVFVGKEDRVKYKHGRVRSHGPILQTEKFSESVNKKNKKKGQSVMVSLF
jgi:hypothetical protein